MTMETKGTRQMVRPKKTRGDCVKKDMKSFGLSQEDAQDKDQRTLKIKAQTANPGLLKTALERRVWSAKNRTILLYYSHSSLVVNSYRNRIALVTTVLDSAHAAANLTANCNP